MKFKLSVAPEHYEDLEKHLTEHGLSLGEDGEYQITEAVSRAALLNVRTSKHEPARIAVDDIVFIEAFGKEIEIHAQKETYYSQERIYQLEARLDPTEYLRISKSVIISRKHVRKIRPSLSMKYILTLSDGSLVDVTRSYYSDFRRFFGF